MTEVTPGAKNQLPVEQKSLVPLAIIGVGTSPDLPTLQPGKQTHVILGGYGSLALLCGPTRSHPQSSSLEAMA